MIYSTGHRDGHGAGRADWAKICVEFRDLQDMAARYGYRDQLTNLADRTRRGEQRIADWHDLRGELAELAADEEHVETQGYRGDPADVFPSSLDPARTGFACPGKLCSRRAGPSLGAVPHCELFRQAMIDLADDAGSSR